MPGVTGEKKESQYEYHVKKDVGPIKHVVRNVVGRRERRKKSADVIEGTSESSDGTAWTFWGQHTLQTG